jgi:isoleucyl-tRNA synthetase
MSERVMTQLSEAYRKIRNTFRFGLGNLSDFDPSRDAVPNDQLEEIDGWMLEHTAELVTKCREWYAGYDFHRVYHAVHDFCVVDLSAFYYDVLKDRLYTKAAGNKSRRSAQTAIWKMTSALVRLIAPVLVFTSEEIWRYLPKVKDDQASVHMSEFPAAESLTAKIDAQKKEAWEELAKVRSAVLVKLEEARNAKSIGGALEAKVSLYSSLPKLHSTLKAYAKQLPALFIVSQVQILEAAPAGSDSAEGSALAVSIEKAAGIKCERCWNYSTHVGENARYPTICERCSEALAEIEGGATHAAT